MKYLLDANAVIALLNGKPGMLAQVQQFVPGEVGISSIVLHELYYGAFKSQRAAKNVDLVARLQFEVLEFDGEDARCAGEVRAKLALAGKPIGAYDVLIAGQALARGLVLVTHNVGEFQRVEGLRLEDWEARL